MFENLNPFLDDYTDILLEELVKSGIIQEAKNPTRPDVKSYRLTKESKENITSSPELNTKESNIIQSFYDFRNILNLVHSNLKADDLKETQGMTLTEIIQRFVDFGAIKSEWQNDSRLKEFFNKADDLMADDEIRSDAISLLEKEKINFNSLVNDIITFYTGEMLKGHFNETLVEKNTYRKERNAPDFILRDLASLEIDLLVEVKLYKRKGYALKESISQCVNILNNYRVDFGLKNQILLVIFSYDDLSGLQRNLYKFKQNMEENFSDYINLIHFIPVGINSLDKLGDEIERTKAGIQFSKTPQAEKKIKTTLRNQPIINGYPDKDDHYVDQIFELDKCSYQVEFSTKTPVEHWRFGIKFSHDKNFPPREKRHGSSYPIFHLEKNADKGSHLYYSYYKETGDQEFGEPSLEMDYKGENIFIRIRTIDDNTIVDVVNAEKKSILKSPTSIGRFKYFRVFAWADSRNPFEFDVEINIKQEKKYLVLTNKIPMISDLEKRIKEINGVLNVYQSEGETGRRYLNVEFSFDANDSIVSKQITDILDS